MTRCYVIIPLIWQSKMLSLAVSIIFIHKPSSCSAQNARVVVGPREKKFKKRSDDLKIGSKWHSCQWPILRLTKAWSVLAVAWCCVVLRLLLVNKWCGYEGMNIIVAALQLRLCWWGIHDPMLHGFAAPALPASIINHWPAFVVAQAHSVNFTALISVLEGSCIIVQKLIVIIMVDTLCIVNPSSIRIIAFWLLVFICSAMCKL